MHVSDMGDHLLQRGTIYGAHRMSGGTIYDDISGPGGPVNSLQARRETKKIGQSCGAIVYPWIQYITIDSCRACHCARFTFFF